MTLRLALPVRGAFAWGAAALAFVVFIVIGLPLLRRMSAMLDELQEDEAEVRALPALCRIALPPHRGMLGGGREGQGGA